MAQLRLKPEKTEAPDDLGCPGLIAREEVNKKAKKHVSGMIGIEDEDLYTDLFTVSWCGERLRRWPNAKDAKSALPEVKSMFSKLLDSYNPEDVLQSISLIPDFDSRIIQEQLDKIEVEEEKKLTNSPLFTEFNKHYPHIDLNLLEKAYAACGENFVEAGVKLLRRGFADNPPNEFASHPTWQSSYHQHLPVYLQQWQKDLKSMQSRMRVAQRAWKVSTS